jgi:succinate-semialdehyde dehydrogenase/glutarate-semialdehyde dehydrogenase
MSAELAGPGIRRVLDRLSGHRILEQLDRDPLPVCAPFNGEVLGYVARDAADDVRAAADRARGAQREWRGESLSKRASILVRSHDLLLDRQREVLDLLQLEAGKARGHAFEEVVDTAMVARYYAHHGAQHLRPRRRRDAVPLLTEAWQYHHPLGVVGIIAPWTHPLTLTIGDAIPALMAGNGVMLKPDS